MTDFECYSLLINIIGIVTTILIIIIAIWGESIRQLLSKPKLKIHLSEPNFNITMDKRKGWYYLIQVLNRRRTSPAQNVRLLLFRVLKMAPDSSWKEQKFSGPTQVMWQWPQITPPYTTIGPQEFSTFCALLENSNQIELRMYWFPNNLKKTIAPNEPTRLEFKAVSDKAESNTILIEIGWDGVWMEDRLEMQNHCIVKEIFA